MICLEDTTDFVVFGCKHEVCVTCFPKIMNTCPECPLCRACLFQEIEVVYETRVRHFVDPPQMHARLCISFAGLLGLLCFLLYLGQTRFQSK